MKKQSNLDIDLMKSDAKRAARRPWVPLVAKAVTFLYLAQIIGPVASTFAQVVAYKNAPAGRRPIMDAANNGVPIVNIAPPSAGGVSRNQYQDFNVNSKGLILNNSRNNSRTQLGGWVAGNPQMGATPARVILNEVVSGNPSSLRGTIEVAGQKAAIVVANPNGVSCDGCGFLNTDRATLAAGSPQFDAGGVLTGFNIAQGKLNVGAHGLSAANVEQLDLIARGIVIEGEVWSKNLNVIAGRNKVLYGTLQAIAQNGSDVTPGFAIDIKELGGMYANQIYMVATEQGLGVNSAGRLAALQGNLTLSANGDLALTDSYAKQNLKMAAAGNITLQSQTIGDGGIQIVGEGNIDNVGEVFSGKGLDILATENFSNRGKLQAESDLSMQAKILTLAGTTVTSNGNVSLTASNGDVQADDVLLYAGGDLTVRAKDKITKTGGTWQAGRSAALSAEQIDNRAANLFAGRTLSLTTTGGILDNRDGTLVGNMGLIVDSSELRNSKGTMATNATLNIDTQNAQLDNTEGKIVGGGAIIRSGELENSGGQIIAISTFDAKTTELKNRGGLLQAAGDLSIDTSDALLDNSLSGINGGIVSGGKMTLSTGGVDNRSGYIASESDQIFIAKGLFDNGIDLESIDHFGGVVIGNGKHEMHAKNVSNVTGSIQASGAMSIIAENILDNRDGEIASNDGMKLFANQMVNGGTIDGAKMDLSAHDINNFDGKIRATAGMSIVAAASFSNGGGAIAATDDLTVHVDGDYVNAGIISSEKKLSVKAANIENDGTMNAGQQLTIQTYNLVNKNEISANAAVLNLSGMLTNADAGLIDAENTTILADAVANTGRIYGDALKIQADSLENNGSGVIAARQKLQLGARSISNTNGGLIYSLGDIAMAGAFGADGQPIQESEKLLNASSKIEATGNINIAAKNLTNRNDELVLKTITTSTPVNKLEIQVYNSSNLKKYSVSDLGWNQKYGRGRHGAYVLPSSVYPFSIYGSARRDPAYTGGCNEDSGRCNYIFRYANSDPIWALMGVSPGQNLEQAQILQAKINAFNADLNSRSFDDWYEYNWTRVNTSETVIDSTRPAEILAGGTISISSSGSVLNDNSNIVAGGAIDIVGATVENRGTQGTKSVSEAGTRRIRYVTSNGKELDYYEQTSLVGAPVVTTTTLQAYTYKPNATASIDSRDLTSNATPADGSHVPVSTPINNQSIGNNQPENTVLPIEAAEQLAGQTTYRDWKVPDNSLFTIHLAPGKNYLVETDPRFTNKNNFLSSDYYLNKLSGSPDLQLKRYGDGFVEQQLINDQIFALTGRRYLTGYTNTEEEYKSLMDAGIAYAQQYQISPGVTLSADQMALLTTDIVLLIKQFVTLADGSVQEVLVPQVYLRRPQEGDLLPSGGLIAGSDVYIKSAGDLVNSGQIAANNETTLLADNNLINRDGRISSQDVYVRANNDLKNISGTILGTGENSKVDLSAGRDMVLETRTIAGETTGTADTIASKRINVDRIATVQGGDVTLDAGRDMIGKASAVLADKDLAVVAGRDIKVNAVENSYAINDQRGGRVTKGRNTYIKEESVANELAVFGAGGNIVMAAGTSGKGDIALSGVNAVAGDSIVMQGSNVTIEAVKDSQLADFQTVGKNRYLRSMKSDETITGGTISTGENLVIRATGEAGSVAENGNVKPIAGTGDVKLSGAYLQSQNGQVGVIANNNVEIGAIKTEHSTAYEYYKKSKSMFSTKVVTIADFANRQQVEGSLISGKSVAVQAGNQIDMTGDVLVKASQIVADNDLQISAGRNLTIGADQQQSKSYYFYEKKKSGMFSGGGFGVTIGSQKLTQKQWVTKEKNVGSTVGSVSGNVNLSAGKQYTQTASQVSSPDGDVNIIAQKVDINAVADSQLARSEQRFKQSGLTVAISSPVISAIQTVQQMAEAAGQTSDGRMQALAGATSALAISDAYGAIQRGQGVDVGDKKNQIVTKTDADGKVTDSRDANAADKVGGINVSISYGSSKSESKSTQASSTAVGSAIAAGGDVTIVAAGAGKDSDITVHGSNITAGNNLALLAEDQINLIAAKNTAEQHSSNKSSSGSLGVSIGTSGFGVTASANSGRGNADGSDVSWTNTHVAAGDQVAMQSGGNTTIRGAVVSGNQVIANVGGDLNIESLQDASQYDSKQKSIGGSITVGAGVSGSISYSKSNAKSDYASVIEQSGIKAGDDGFQVNVGGNTDLKGAVIASTEQAVEDQKNMLVTSTITTTDIKNYANASASSSGINLSSDMVTQGKYGIAKALIGNGMNNGKDSGSSSGITRSAVEQGVILLTDETAQQLLTGKGADEMVASLNRDTVNAQHAAQKLDVGKMLETAEAERTIKQATFKQAVAVTDAVYKSATGAKKIILRKCDGQGQNCSSEVVDMNKHKLAIGPDGKVYVFNHGIMNTEEQALENAEKQSDVNALEQGVYVVINPHTGSPIAEVVYAAWDAVASPIFGISNASEANIDLREQVKAAGGMIVEVDHSRGNITSFNATQAQLQMGETDVPLRVMQMNGSPVNAWAAQQVLDVATELNAKVFQSTHQNDFVSTFFGRNPATGGLVSSFMEAHTNYGPNADPKITNDIWGLGLTSPSLPAYQER